ncbi:MAG TPA: hypothetical protein DDW55_10425, partial [Gammaproteobacteria bacterium]|nr:hypothetical protein [Gammaproteobacteria bacterium]
MPAYNSKYLFNRGDSPVKTYRFKVFSILFGTSLMLIPATAISAGSAQVTGTLGSPSTTTSIDGKQLPPPPDKHFGGKIERNVIDSTPYWPPRMVP